MLRWLAATFFSLLLLVGCGGNSNDTPTPNNTPPPSEPSDNTNPGNQNPPANNPSNNFGTPNESMIRPGVRLSSSDGSCTSNFLYQDTNGDYYLGAAAHCFSPDTNMGIDACETRNQAIGSSVTIENANHPGMLMYSSWRAMQANGETPGSSACVFNDFSLVLIDHRDYANIHPSAIAFGGPTGLLTTNAAINDDAFSYGQSPLHQGIRMQEEKFGDVAGQTPDGWQYSIVFDNAALPGDSGSAVLHQSGQALGVLTVVSTCVGICPPVNNGVMNLNMGLDYANNFLGLPVQLVTWSRFFANGNAP